MTAAVLAASSVAFGIAGLGTVETADTSIDAYKTQRGDVIDTSPIGEVVRDYDTTRAMGMEAVVNVDVGEATDMQFQRRTETVLVNGVETEVVKDYAFVGISDIGGSFNGFDILDITEGRRRAGSVKVETKVRSGLRARETPSLSRVQCPQVLKC